MKALVLAAAFAALSSTAPAGVARDTRPQAVVDQASATVISDASPLGATALTSLNNNASPWAPQSRQAEIDFDSVTGQVDTGTWVIVLGVLAVALARPVGRALRRHEEHRRAAALASTLGNAPRH